ncbi:MAG TPA: hypothetical protein VHR47_07255 [Bacillota bacterium]|jgi:transcriptional regulator with XRE-family HTH domain|nr:hypothetical protein [Bacillota bacterium]
MKNDKIDLNRRNIRLLQEEREITDVELARMVGVSTSQMSRIKLGQSSVGTVFIVGILRAFPELRFEDLFIVDR